MLPLIVIFNLKILPALFVIDWDNCNNRFNFVAQQIIIKHTLLYTSYAPFNCYLLHSNRNMIEEGGKG